MINTLFGDINYSILPKQKEVWDKYCKVIQWGRANPTRFIEEFFKMDLTDHQKYIILSSWIPANVVWVCSRSSGKAQTLDTKVYPVLVDGTEDNSEFSHDTIRKLEIGDYIVGDNGKPTQVVHLNPIIFEESYKITFSDGDIVECNKEHLWRVFDKEVNNNEKPLVADTDYIYHHFNDTVRKGLLDYRFQVPLEGVEYKEEKDKYNSGKYIVSVEKTGIKKAMRCITVDNASGCYLCGNNRTVTHNSFMSAPFIMARSILMQSHNTYIMAPTGSQAQETFTKLENIAKNNIASVVGVSSVFLEETIRQNSKADPFVHDKNSYHVELYNGSTINTLNSVAENIVGKMIAVLKIGLKYL